MPDHPTSTVDTPTVPDISVTLERTAIGLALHLSPTLAYTPPTRPTFADHTFTCSAPLLTLLISHITATRPNITQQVLSGHTVTLLAPQADPPTIRVTNPAGHKAYFNLGELWRWRFLATLPGYPFKTHQQTGMQWLRGRSAAILADDMGLGKTLQAIAALDSMYRSGDITNALIVCPKSLLGVWEAELNLWSPWLCVVALHSRIEQREWKVITTQSHVAITNYEAIRHSRPLPKSFNLVIFDEIQKLKNPNSLNYTAAYELKPKFAWGLSGTPLENHAGDLAAILHLLDRARVAHTDRHLPPRSLRSVAARYILRRGRAVISQELPDVIQKTELIPLSTEQRITYDALRRGHSVATLGAWIAFFNRLRDVCDYDPHTMKSSKIDRAMAIVDAVRALREKAVVFSWKIRPLHLLYRRLSSRHGVSAAAMITGETASTARSRIVASFQSDDTPHALLCSTRATAEGLTLTAANHVVFLNEWWNPAVNAQARDRVNRIGQTKTVYVYRLRSQGTLESRLDDLLESKSELFNEIVSRLARHDVKATTAVPAALAELLDDTTST